MKNKRIKILAPIDRLEEAELLIDAGADEFFCGVMIGNRGMSSKREGDTRKHNLESISALRKLVSALKKADKKIFLALNSPSRQYLKEIKENIKKFKDIGVDGVIFGHLDLLDRLKNCGLKIIASSYLETKNLETAEFLSEEFNVKRIILDRQITLSDLKSITSALPKMEFETFIMNAACRSLASACHCQLVARNIRKKGFYGRHFCLSPFSVSQNRNLRWLKEKDYKIIASRLTAPPAACGICALYHFQKYGITSVKIVGRGYPTETKVKHVKFVKDALEILKNGQQASSFYAKAEKLYEKTFNKKCRRKYCYYPHFFKNKN